MTAELILENPDAWGQDPDSLQPLADLAAAILEAAPGVRTMRDPTRGGLATALLDLARSKEITAKAIKSLDDLMGTGDDDISRVAEGIRARLDKASARSEMLADSLDAQMDEVLEKGMLEAQLAERKARLGLSD